MQSVLKILVIAFFCSVSTSIGDLQLGKPLPKEARVINTGKRLVLKGPADGRLGKEIQFNGIDYQVTVDEKGLVDFITTYDSSFRTPEKVKTTDLYRKIKKLAVREFYVVGYGYKVTLRSGWVALFMDDHITKTGRITDTCQIKRFIRSK